MCLPGQRSLIIAQMSAVHSALGRDQGELVALERRHWIDLGRRAGEWLAGTRALSLFWAKTASIQALEEAHQCMRAGQGCVVFTAHYGHWELLAAWLVHRGYDFLTVASAPPRGALGSWLSAQRASMGVQVIHPRGGARRARRHLAGGGVVALLIDHATAERSITHPFLQREAPHTLTADRLTRSAEVAALWVCSRRDAEGGYEVIARSLNGSVAREAHDDPPPLAYSCEAHRRLERLIIESPEQWLWLHRRWTPRELH